MYTPTKTSQYEEMVRLSFLEQSKCFQPSNKYKSPAWLEEVEFFPESEDEMEIVEFSLDDFLSANNEFLASNVGA